MVDPVDFGIGYYVEDKPFGMKIAQARAYAKRRCHDCRRDVDVILQGEGVDLSIVHTEKWHEPTHPKIYKPVNCSPDDHRPTAEGATPAKWDPNYNRED